MTRQYCQYNDQYWKKYADWFRISNKLWHSHRKDGSSAHCNQYHELKERIIRSNSLKEDTY